MPGTIFEFGVHRGRHLATFTTLRARHEPYNPRRGIVGFDTFTGFPGTSDKDSAPTACASCQVTPRPPTWPGEGKPAAVMP